MAKDLTTELEIWIRAFLALEPLVPSQEQLAIRLQLELTLLRIRHYTVH